MDYVCVFPIINLFPYIFMKDFAGNCFFVAKEESYSTSRVQKRLIFAEVLVYFLPSLNRV